MADLITVDDPDDPRLRDYTGLTDVELRRRREPAEGLFIAEGEKVIRRARLAGYEMRSMLLSAKWVDVMRDVIDEVPAPVYAVSPELAEQVTGYHVHRGALASMQRKPLPASGELLGRTLGTVVRQPAARRVAVFEDIVDHANLGAAFRNAAALGVDAVFLTPGCADPLYRRSVKVSMGGVFQVPWTRFESWPKGVEALRSEGFTVAALCLSERAITLDELAARKDENLALVFGTEGIGLTPRTLAAVDEHVRIPMDAGVDSLNVAAASAVAFYATRPGAA
ncbi:TrmH family RNA methyltransferase [Streptomyces sp. NPDC090052]|uniref:TrmH family RNA methyltransferase n=1 Tax=unclassified Streptomyces TaxID=2593676 RepID=UPI00224DEEE2|nr:MULTISPECIES: RNA methyltransferase [unclassified Streptomyces]MCX4727692.1 RNA methyltransferase [Streptomyces sp. NBC_01306]WSV03097.1 RNA methyltransferase [Streptomyces sp. NBC_01020]WSX41125.1 RNA methyltransferase [Streptomyces sp. NBC_00963]WSX70898.1 RNA methyltransferase [Streptomyces sp. NBC_00932]